VAWLGQRAGEGEDEREVAARLETMKQLLDETLETTRRLSAELRPELLDELGLPAAVAWRAHQLETRTGIACAVDLPAPEALPLDRRCALGLYRVLQEALTNVARHAGARRVTVRLTVDGEEVLLAITDDGRGITAEEQARPASLGLLGMRERVAAMGGRLTIDGEPGAGTTVTARVPRGTATATARTAVT
jgi:signal transduction histidine kinase